jgi:thiopurine S-methyltransferase
MDITSKEYWQEQYTGRKTGWDIGYISPPIKEYIDQLSDKNLKILIPGAGNAYEAEYLYKNGFKNVTVIDIVKKPLENFKNRFTDFPDNQLIECDFFSHNVQYDLIVEHTFFSAFPVSYRAKYVEKMHELLNPKGKLIGLLFDKDFGNPFPPFGGDYQTYFDLFSKKFQIKCLEKAYNSIKPRLHYEFFIIFERK